jgi:hypothetical protein
MQKTTHDLKDNTLILIIGNFIKIFNNLVIKYLLFKFFRNLDKLHDF